mgnify:CR=1 FL=1
MMNKMCMAAIIAASLYAGTTFAQPAAVKKIIETGQTDNRVMHQWIFSPIVLGEELLARNGI